MRWKERGTHVDPAMLSALEIPESERAELRFDVHGDAPGEEGLSASGGDGTRIVGRVRGSLSRRERRASCQEGGVYRSEDIIAGACVVDSEAQVIRRITSRE